MLQNLMLVPFNETEWFNIIMTALATIIASLLMLGFNLFKTWVKTKIKNEKANNAIYNVLNVVESAVLTVQQTMVDDLKEDGKFNKEKQEQALKNAVNLIMNSINEETEEILTGLFGDIETWIRMQIESFINKNKG